MRLALGRTLEHQKLARRRILRDQPHRAMHDRIGEIPLAREPGIIPRRPPRPPPILERNQLRGARGFGFGWSEKLAKAVEHGERPTNGKRRVARARWSRVGSAVPRTRRSA